MDDNSSDIGPEPAQLRFLRRLVTVLTSVMILGLLTIVALLVIRVMAPGTVPLPAEISLPDGTTATAFTRGPDWYAVVTEKNEILIFDAASGEIRQTVQVGN